MLLKVLFFTLQPGRLKAVQAIGWYLEEANMAQVSVNITDHDITPIHTVYEEVVKDVKVSLSIHIEIMLRDKFLCWTNSGLI